MLARLKYVWEEILLQQNIAIQSEKGWTLLINNRVEKQWGEKREGEMDKMKWINTSSMGELLFWERSFVGSGEQYKAPWSQEQIEHRKVNWIGENITISPHSLNIRLRNAPGCPLPNGGICYSKYNNVIEVLKMYVILGEYTQRQYRNPLIVKEEIRDVMITNRVLNMLIN